MQDEDDADFKGGLEALRGHVLAFPKEGKRGEMDRDMDDDNLMVRPAEKTCSSHTVNNISGMLRLTVSFHTVVFTR